MNELFADQGLLLRNASRDAAGTYQCFVSNVAGTVSAAATVRVTDQRSSVTDPPQHNHWRGQRQSDVQNIAPEGMYLFSANCFISI